MKKIRILVANEPRMMREVVKEIIQRQEDMEVVGDMVGTLDLLVAVRERGADAVILGLEDLEEQGVCSHLLAEYPALTILTLAPNGRTALIRPGRREIAEPSEAEILSALRHAIQGQGKREERLEPD